MAVKVKVFRSQDQIFTQMPAKLHLDPMERFGPIPVVTEGDHLWVISGDPDKQKADTSSTEYSERAH
jgi:hypothetical protein